MKSPLQLAEELFHRALELPAVERATFLAHACGDKTELRAQIGALLAAHEQARGFLLTNAGGTSSGTPPPALEMPALEQPGSVIGCYKLLQKIGEGGMGVVYLAEQEQPLRRRVALKIIKLGMDTRSMIARFEVERQALALMEHANIAKVFDGGVTEAGRPYFVMELVTGVPVTEFCDQNRLPVHQRLNLFIKVCAAIQHAHQKGIIHRDIKPSNILVTLDDSVPVPKVIDFGVAKTLDQKLTEKTLFTHFATLIGTPTYMSPEQAEMNGMDVDTRSDVYSLGVLLYELLTGSTPFSEKRLRSLGYGEMQRVIMVEEPERPSTRLTKVNSSASPVADSVPCIPRTAFDPDLDWIVMKCLEKDRNRRYETANGLAADLQRYLGNEPIFARPPSLGYRLEKAILRNRLAFTAAAAVVCVLTAGVAISTWQSVRARRAEQAEQRARTLAERRLQIALEFVNRTYQDVSLQLWQITGTAKANERLVTNGLAFVEQLRGGEQLPPQMRTSLGNLYVRLAQAQGWGRGNTTADYEGGLRWAVEAVRLLTPDPSVMPEEYHYRQLARAEMVAAVAASNLLLSEEAIAHFQEAARWASRLTNSPSQGAQALTLWSAALGACVGQVLLDTGRTEEALTNHFLPFLHQLQERQISEQSDWFDFSHLGLAHGGVGRAYAALNQPEAAVVHRREALRIARVAVADNSKAAEYLHEEAVATAELGESLLALNQSEGKSMLQTATKRASTMVSLDPESAGCADALIEVLRYSAQGWLAWATNASATRLERRERLEQAQTYLTQAENRTRELRSESQKRYWRHHLERTRVALNAANEERGKP